MRNLVTLSVPCSLAIAALVACEQDPEGGGDFQLDAGVGDVYVPPSPDATAPAEPDASSPKEVTVSVVGQGGPKENVRVVFHDENGAVLETKLTGPDGKATSTGATPAMASALLAFEKGFTARHIVTWTGVVGGDELVARDLLELDEEIIGTYAVQLPGPAGDGQYLHRFDASDCVRFSTDLNAEISLEPRCVRPKGTVLVSAMPLGTEVAEAFSFAKGLDSPTDGSAVAVESGPWTQASSLEMTLSNVPDVQDDGWVTAELSYLADGARFRGSLADVEATTLSFPTPVGFADAYQAELRVREPGSRRSLLKRFGPAPSVALDAGELLPRITDGAVHATNVRQPVVTWTPSSAMIADGGLVRVGFSGADDASHTWTFVVGPSATSVTAPSMPPEAESFLPASGATPDVYWPVPDVMFVEADAIPEYASFRRGFAAILATAHDGFLHVEVPALPVDGTYKMTAFADDS